MSGCLISMLADAARVLLGCIGFVEERVAGLEAAKWLVERLGILRGASGGGRPWGGWGDYHVQNF